MSEFISVIVTTRDNPEALDHCLRALERQTDCNFEIVVADDGSGINTARAIRDWVPRLPVPLKHAWHESRGRRVGEIRNRGLRISAGRYCIFFDGDCLVLPEFVATHRNRMSPGQFVVGPLLAVSRRLSEQIMVDGVDLAAWRRGRWLSARWHGDIARPPRPVPGSFACWRRDLDAIDGFECGISEPDASDADTMARLTQLGLRRVKVGFAAATLHLWHPLRSAADPMVAPAGVAGAGDARRDGARAAQGLSAVVREIEESWQKPEHDGAAAGARSAKVETGFA